MKPGQDKRYTYAVGRIRVLESRLLNKQVLERLIEAETMEEAAFILKEYGLSDNFNENLAKGYKVLDELSLEAGLADSFRKKYSFRDEKAAAPDKFIIGYIFKVLSRYPFLKDYFKRYIDLKNLSFYFRLKDKELLKEALLDNGYLKKKIFLSELDIKDARLYEAIITEGLEGAKKEGDFGFFEKLCDDYLLNRLKPAKYFPFGVEPLFGYVVAVEYQSRNINAILFSKKNGISKEYIRQNLREGYV